MRLGRFFNTTAFRLSAIYLAGFSVFAVLFVVYISYATDQLLARQLRETIDTEIRSLAEQAGTGGIGAVVAGVDRRSRRPGASLYLIVDVTGRIVAGNIAEVPAAVLDRADEEPFTVGYVREEGETAERLAMVRVVSMPGGLTMLVGRDIAERERFREIIGQSIAWAAALLLVLGAISWFFVSRRVLSRIDSVSATSRRIMDGDLTGRLEVTGSGDEFDRLAASLNAMLERIEGLMRGLKEVSDNIAHDLKTPLTRLRNRVESTLGGSDDPAAYRAALESTIEDADQLIRVFNALLIIAQVEAGTPDKAGERVDVAEIVRDVAELYEPAAESAGGELTAKADGPLFVRGNRELIGQAIANLIDNALKYGSRDGEGSAGAHVAVAAEREGDRIVITVADDGPGIAAKDRERVLERFVRLEESRSAPGSGLGLSLVAAVARLHGGEIALLDNLPRGLRVVLRLPALVEAA